MYCIYSAFPNVCLGFFVPLENNSLKRRRPYCRCRFVNLYMYLAHKAIEHRGFFSVLHLVWDGYVEDKTPVAEGFTLELSQALLIA